MRPFSKLVLGFAVADVGLLVGLYWPDWGLGLLALPLWGLALLGAGEPQPTRSPRHADVRRNEETALGKVLMYREGWIIERPAIVLALLVLLSALTAASFVALTPRAEDQQAIARAIAWTPALLLGGGFLFANTVNIWALSFTAAFLWLLFTVLLAVQGDGMTALRVACGGLSVVVSLWSIDLLRGARRALERGKPRRAVVDGVEVPSNAEPPA